MEITKREVLFSSIIIGIMLIIGFMLSGRISDSMNDRNEVYNKAIHIEDPELFKYGMRTNVGNAFVYGDLVALDTVSYPEIEGEYLYVKKVKERYTQHTRTVRYKCGTRTCHRIEHYWTWDRVGSEKKASENVTFLGVEFEFQQFKTPSDHYLTTVKTSPTVRYKYYVVSPQITGTIFADLREGNIGEEVPIYEASTSAETYERLTTGRGGLWLFWMVWIAMIGGAVYGFYYLENEWLY